MNSTECLVVAVRKLIVTAIVIVAVASALLLVALLSWTTYQHYHERTSATLDYRRS